ncbi:MAG: protein-L-isoaspartate O-methyltransferase [Rhodobacterales bacterium]|nr:protein-L-isoaspartate O-methyltransferase [Rhodobacterales bacterium]
MADYETRRIMMVDTQVRPSDVTKFPIIEAMLHIPRELYVPVARREAAYMGENLDLGGGRVVMEPRTLAKLIDSLDVQRGDVVLDIGCGLGYSTAVLARLAEFVVAVEDDPARADAAQATLSDQGVDNAAVITGPLATGAAKSGPYDVVLLQGAVEVMPQAILAQLREGGRIGCLFAEGALGVARIGLKTDGRVTWRFAFNAGAPVLPGFGQQPAFVL